MLEQNSLADEIWNEIKPMFEERDFLRGEGDRLHALFVHEREKADEAHASLVEMLSKVNEMGTNYVLSMSRERWYKITTNPSDRR